jgi:hypothetical protein
MVRMVGGKTKGRRGSIVSVLVQEVTAELAEEDRVDAAINAWMRGQMTDADVATVEAALAIAERRVRAGEAA